MCAKLLGIEFRTNKAWNRLPWMESLEKCRERPGATKHCCDRGFGFSRLNLQWVYEVSPENSLSVRISGEFELPRNRLSRCNCTWELEAREHGHGKMGLLVFWSELFNSVFFKDNACCLSEYQSNNALQARLWRQLYGVLLEPLRRQCTRMFTTVCDAG